MPSGPSYTGSPVASIEGNNGWMDQVNKQVDLMRRQQSTNIEGQRVENARASKEREASLQNLYDFDVSSFTPEQAAMIKEAQDGMASNISEHKYQTSQQLTYDVAKIANYYNKFKAEASSVNERRSNYLGETDHGNGIKGTGDQPGYKRSNTAWNEHSGYGKHTVSTEPGALNISSFVIGVDGDQIGDAEIDVMENQAHQGFFNQSISEAEPWSAYSFYENERDRHPSKAGAEGWAAEKFQNDDGRLNAKIQEQHKRKYPNSGPLSEAEALEKFVSGIGQAWTDRATAAVATPMFGNKTYGSTDQQTSARELTTPISIIGLGEVSYVANVNGRLLTVHEDDDGEPVEVVLDSTSDEFKSIVSELSKGNDANAARFVSELINPPGSAQAGAGEVAQAGAGAGEVAQAGEVADTGDKAVSSLPTEKPSEVDQAAPDTKKWDDKLQGLNKKFNKRGLMRKSDAARIANEILTAEAAPGSGILGNQRVAMSLEDQVDYIQRKLDKYSIHDQSSKKYQEVQMMFYEADRALTEQNKQKEALKTRSAESTWTTKEDILREKNVSSPPPVNASSSLPLVKGKGADITYARPSNANLEVLESGDAQAGSTNPQRKLAFEEATRLARESGHPFPEVVAAQFALESAYGKKKSANYNYFGLKSSNTMIQRLAKLGIEATAGKPVETPEVIDGVEQTIDDSFLSFNSPEDAFTAYLIFIDTTELPKSGGRRYGRALDESKTALDYLKGIKKAKYATATDYVNSVDSVANGFGINLSDINRIEGS